MVSISIITCTAETTDIFGKSRSPFTLNTMTFLRCLNSGLSTAKVRLTSPVFGISEGCSDEVRMRAATNPDGLSPMSAYGSTAAWNPLTRRSTTDEDFRHHDLRLDFLTLLILTEHLIFLKGAGLVRDPCRQIRKAAQPTARSCSPIRKTPPSSFTLAFHLRSWSALHSMIAAMSSTRGSA